jgi:RHS repeat-associated protein
MVDSAQGETDYTYDANDRLLTETTGGVVTKYTYDNNGNTLSKFTSAVDQALYEWDAQNRLVGAKVTDASSTKNLAYQYDADGIRVSSSVDGDVTRYLIDTVQPYAQVLEEYTRGGVVKVSYVYGNDLISQNRGGAKSFYHVDGLGSTRALTNDNGKVTDRYVYDAFGRMIGQSGNSPNVYLFVGEQRDANVRLDYLRARYLDFSAGRFLNQDRFTGSLHDPFSLHRFAFANANPVNNVDPSGRFTLTELVTVTEIESVLRTVSQVVIGKELFDRIDNTINNFELAAFFFSVGLVFGLSDVLEPGFPYTVETLDHSKEFTLKNESRAQERIADIVFKYNDINLSGVLNFTHLEQSHLNADIRFEGNKAVIPIIQNRAIEITLTLEGIHASTTQVPLEVGADLTLTGKIVPLNIEKKVEINLNLGVGED